MGSSFPKDNLDRYEVKVKNQIKRFYLDPNYKPDKENEKVPSFNKIIKK